MDAIAFCQPFYDFLRSLAPAGNALGVLCAKLVPAVARLRREADVTPLRIRPWEVGGCAEPCSYPFQQMANVTLLHSAASGGRADSSAVEKLRSRTAYPQCHAAPRNNV